MVDWEFYETWESLDPYYVNIYRSTNPAWNPTDFTLIASGIDPVSISSYEDLTVSGFRANQWEDFYYTVVPVHASTLVSGVIPTPTRLETQMDLTAREIIRRKYLALKLSHGGKTFQILKRKKSGSKCTECFDPILQRRTKEECTTCFDTSWIGGYFAPITITATIGAAARRTLIELFGEWESQDTFLRMGPYPVLSSQDILIDEQNRRWRVVDNSPTEKGQYIVTQQCRLTRIHNTDVVYQYPISGFTSATYMGPVYPYDETDFRTSAYTIPTTQVPQGIPTVIRTAHDASTPTIGRISVSSFTRGSLTITWDFFETWEPLDSYSVSIYRGTTPAWHPDDYVLIASGLDPVNTNEYVDTTVSGYQSYQWQDFYYTAVPINVNTGASGVVFTPTRLQAPMNLLAKEIIRRKTVALRPDYGGAPFLILKRKKGGTRCSNCWDDTLQKRTMEACPVCFDTGWVGGYWRPITTSATMGGASRQTLVNIFGEWEQANTFLKMGPYPVVSPQDIVIDQQNRRWRIIDIAPVEKNQFIVTQQCRMIKIHPLDVIYTYPVSGFDSLVFDHYTYTYSEPYGGLSLTDVTAQ